MLFRQLILVNKLDIVIQMMDKHAFKLMGFNVILILVICVQHSLI